MKILVIGSGAREHAIVKSLQGESAGHHIICAPGNAGMTCERELQLAVTDPAAVADYASANAIELVVIGPEAPLVAGVADPLRELGIPVFGPSKAAAQIEGSKSYAKRIMAEAGVPTGGAKAVLDRAAGEAVLREYGAPYVVKADGLAAGKGVLVTEDFEAALDHVATWAPHGEVLIEEFLSGPEVSLFFFSDGVNVLPLTPAQDFKRIFDNDEGPNTGGMGSYSPLPWLEDGFIEQVTREVAKPTVDRMREEGTPFVGLLYCGLILTPAGIKVIEFNARFGDPETQIVLARMQSNLSEYLLASATGGLAGLAAPEFTDDVGICVVLASEGYPGDVPSGRVVTGIAEAESVTGVSVLHAATAAAPSDAPSHDPVEPGIAADTFIATGGRVLSVVARGADFASAREAAYDAISRIKLEGSQYRSDIALKVV